MAKICKKCGKEFPTYVKIDGKRRNLSSRKYCLDCSPFGQHNTKQIGSDCAPPGFKLCSSCKRLLPTSEYYVRENGSPSSYCKSCVSAIKVKQNQNLKLQCVEYKGNVCSHCGRVFHPSLYDFHHIDPDKKDFSISRYRGVALTPILKKELDKCILVCANCHAEIHVTLSLEKLKESFIDRNFDTGIVCPCCQRRLPSHAFWPRHRFCKTCYNYIGSRSLRVLKQQCVVYKGGACIKCGYLRCNAALSFHHVNPEEKEFTLSHCRKYRFEDVQAEIDKCQLLCKNCHRLEHID